MKKHPIYTGSVDDAFQRVRSRVNNLIANHLPDSWGKLNTAFELLESEQNEKWSNAVHSCRGILENLADLVYPPTNETRIFKNKKEPSKLTQDKYMNRIMAFIEDAENTDTFKSLLSSNVELFCNLLHDVNDASNKYSHNIISNHKEADRYMSAIYFLP